MWDKKAELIAKHVFQEHMPKYLGAMVKTLLKDDSGNKIEVAGQAIMLLGGAIMLNGMCFMSMEQRKYFAEKIIDDNLDQTCEQAGAIGYQEEDVEELFEEMDTVPPDFVLPIKLGNEVEKKCEDIITWLKGEAKSNEEAGLALILGFGAIAAQGVSMIQDKKKASKIVDATTVALRSMI